MAQAISVSLTELKAPFSDCLIAEGDAAQRQHLFDIAGTPGRSENITRRNDWWPRLGSDDDDRETEMA